MAEICDARRPGGAPDPCGEQLRESAGKEGGSFSHHEGGLRGSRDRAAECGTHGGEAERGARVSVRGPGVFGGCDAVYE